MATNRDRPTVSSLTIHLDEVSSVCALQVLSHVCRTWRWVSLNTPSLWTTIQIRRSTSRDKVLAWIKRSEAEPLNVFVRMASMRVDLNRLISENSHRLQTLHVIAENQWLIERLYTIAAGRRAANMTSLKLENPFPSDACDYTSPVPFTKERRLSFIGPVRMPLLEVLTVEGCGMDWEPGTYERLVALKLASLPSCKHHAASEAYRLMPCTDSRLTIDRLEQLLLSIPKLQTLDLHEEAFLQDADNRVSDLFSDELPHCLSTLETLALCGTSNTFCTLLQLIHAPNLKSLMLRCGRVSRAWDFRKIYLTLYDRFDEGQGWPSVTSLVLEEIRCDSTEQLREFFSFLPCLTSLAIHYSQRLTFNDGVNYEVGLDVGIPVQGPTGPLLPCPILEELVVKDFPTELIERILKSRHAANYPLKRFINDSLRPYHPVAMAEFRKYGVTTEERGMDFTIYLLSNITDMPYQA